MESRDSLWPTVMGYFLWAISAAIGLGALFAVIDTIERVAFMLIVPGCDPLRTVECAGTVRTVMMASYMLLGIIWLVWYILLIERYTRSKTAEELARRFAITTAIQIGLIAVWVILDRLVIT